MRLALRKRAITLRKNGWSYNVIAQRLNVSKSTLSDWLTNIPFVPNAEVIKRIHGGQLKSALFKNQQRIASIQRGKTLGAESLGKLNQRDLLMVGLGVYIGEGSKSYSIVRVINADPNVIRIAIRWFRTVYGLTTKNFVITLHIYPDLSIRACKQYWSRTTGIPSSQFGKTQIDLRINKSGKKHKKLPYGTAHLGIRSCGNPLHGSELHRLILGSIEAVYKQMRV